KAFRPPLVNPSQIFTDYTRSIPAAEGQQLWVGASHGYPYTPGLSAACFRAVSADVEGLARKKPRAVRVEARRMLSEERRGAAELKRNATSDAIWLYTSAE